MVASGVRCPTKSPIVFRENPESTRRCTQVCLNVCEPGREHRFRLFGDATSPASIRLRAILPGRARRLERKPPARLFRAPLLQVVEERLAYRWRQRIGRRMSGLASANVKAVAFPVDVVQRQRPDFTSAQPIRHQEQEDRVVALANRTPPVDLLQHPFHFAPGNRARQVRETISAGDSMALPRSRVIRPTR